MPLPPDRRPEVLADLRAAIRRAHAACGPYGWVPSSDDLPMVEQQHWDTAARAQVDRLDAVLAALDEALTAADLLETLDTIEVCRGR